MTLEHCNIIRQILGGARILLVLVVLFLWRESAALRKTTNFLLPTSSVFHSNFQFDSLFIPLFLYYILYIYIIIYFYYQMCNWTPTLRQLHDLRSDSQSSSEIFLLHSSKSKNLLFFFFFLPAQSSNIRPLATVYSFAGLVAWCPLTPSVCSVIDGHSLTLTDHLDTLSHTKQNHPREFGKPE